MDLDSDLEEGEIVDSPPPSPQILNINKRKDLPQRYVVKDNKTPLHKHKKSCKHSVRHHAKKPPKIKKSPAKKKSTSPKFHHKPSCTYEKSNRVLGRHNSSNISNHTFPKNGFHPQNSLIPEMKDSFKHAPPFKKQRKNFDKPKSLHTFVEENFKTSKKDFAISEISSAKKYKDEVDGSVAGNISTNFELSENVDSILELSKNSDDISVIELDVCEPSPPPLIDLIDSPDSKSPTPKLNSGTDINDVSNTNSNTSQVKDEESEDEEELRRIALATCAKRKILQEPENIAQNTSQHCEENDLSDKVQNPPEVINSQAADNYEVVDMDLDDDDDGMQVSLETAQISVTNETESTENLFIIDTHPSCDFMQNRKKSDSQPHAADNSDDEDFQANILRAELINSMYRKKLYHEGPKQSDTVSCEKQMPIVNRKKFLLNYHKQKLQFSYKRLKSAKHFLRKRSVNNFVSIKNINSNTNKTPLPVPPNKPIERHIMPVPANKPIEKRIVPVPTNKPVERLIMPVPTNKPVERLIMPVPSNKPIERLIMPVPSNKPTERLIITVNGESSDDSDEDETNPASENPLDSISALISDCRQKSESNEKTEEIVPKAVECLSKAQQEEYNSLKRILATKTKLPSSKVALSTKNGSVHSPLDDLKKLEKKLVVLRGDLQNKKESMSTLSEEVNTKKLHYMKAKLTAQHLKEQLVAAEKIRKAKLLNWSKTCDNLKLMRQSVSDLENKMNEVQSLCSKLGSSLQGQSYKLPLLSSCNGQL